MSKEVLEREECRDLFNLFHNGHATGEEMVRAVESAVLEKLAGMDLPEPLAGEQSVFEDWLHDCPPSGDAESVQTQWLASYEYRSFLELQEFTAAQLRQAYAQGAASVLSAEPFTHYRHYDEQVQSFADDGTIPLYTLKTIE